MKFSSVENEYLLEMLKAALKSAPIKQAPPSLNWQELVSLARKQQVYSIIAPILDSVNMPSEQAQELKLYNQSELIRLIAMKNEQEKLEKELEQRGIRFMPLKGCLIRQYYPQQKMRQMSDVDILYDGSKREELFSLMEAEGYSVISCSENSDDFTKKPFYTFEFHRDLFFKEHDFYCDFSNAWDNAVPDENNSCKLNMSREDLYLHSIAHMNKHYRFGGFGVRFLVDTYLLIKSDWQYYDKKYITSRLEEMGLTEFESFMRKLSLVLFDGGVFNDEQIAFLNSSLKFGIYGHDEGIKVYYEEYKKNAGERATPFSFFCSKLFPTKEFMKRVYPVLESKGYLLPYFYVYRLIKKFIFSRKTTIKNYKVLKQYINDNE